MQSGIKLTSISKQNVWLIAGAASLPLAWYWWSRSSRRATKPSTDFSSFLKSDKLLKKSATRTRTRSIPSTSFDAFVKVPRRQTKAAVTDFSSFLKVKSSAIAPGGVKKSKKGKGQDPPPPTAARILLLYATEYGFSKEISEKLQSMLPKDHYWPVVMNMANLGNGYDFSKEQVVVVVCSTQGDGVPPSEAREFCDWLFADKAGDLSHLNFSVCALGDKSYPHFCKCGKQVDAALERAGAKKVVDRVDINKEDWVTIDGWIQAVMQVLPTLGLTPVGEQADFEADDAAVGGHTHTWGKSRPYYGRVVAIEGLCNVSGPQDKNTIRVEVDLGASGLTYLPGDALGIFPHNSEQSVDTLLAALGWDGSQLAPVPKWHYEESAEQLQADEDGCVPVRELLKRCYDLRSPKPEIFQVIKQHSKAGQIVEVAANGNGLTAKADGAANGNGEPHENGASNGHEPVPGLDTLIDNADARDAYLDPRHIIDVIEDFWPVKLNGPVPMSTLLACMRPLQARLYSISSSPLEHPTRVQATIAEVKYSCLEHERVGVCSTFVSDRIQVDDQVAVYIHKNPDFRLPPDPSTPIIMVGPGTGLAPFRSFILQRLLEHKASRNETSSLGPMTLFFGCRRSDQDYLYGPVLEKWAEEGVLHLSTAFSRQQAKKVYVQQRLAENSELVWKQLQAGGHFYVCGDASSMAGAVEQALLDIIEANVEGGREGAQAYLDSLSQTGRYQRDVWF